MEETNECVITYDGAERIKFSRIEAAANGEIPEEELTETEKVFVQFYLKVYDRAFCTFISHYEEQMNKVTSEWEKNDNISDVNEV